MLQQKGRRNKRWKFISQNKRMRIESHIKCLNVYFDVYIKFNDDYKTNGMVQMLNTWIYEKLEFMWNRHHNKHFMPCIHMRRRDR